MQSVRRDIIGGESARHCHWITVSCRRGVLTVLVRVRRHFGSSVHTLMDLHAFPSVFRLSTIVTLLAHGYISTTVTTSNYMGVTWPRFVRSPMCVLLFSSQFLMCELSSHIVLQTEKSFFRRQINIVLTLYSGFTYLKVVMAILCPYRLCTS